MAKIITNDFAVISGSINGKTYSRNRYSAYIRNRTKPVNPQTQNQMIQRSILTSLTKSWTSLSDDQRSAWTTAALGYNFPNGVEGFYTPTGFQLYNMQNMNRLLAGLALLTAPSTAAGVMTFDSMTAVISSTLNSFTVTAVNAAGPTTVKAKIYATPPVKASLGAGSIKNLFRMLRNSTDNSAVIEDPAVTGLGAGMDISTQYAYTLYPPWNSAVTSIAPLVIWVKVILINADFTDSSPVIFKSTGV